MGEKSKFDILWDIISNFLKNVVIWIFWGALIVGIMKIGAHFPDITGFLQRVISNGIPFVGGGTRGPGGITLGSYGIFIARTSDAARANDIVDNLKHIGSYRASATIMRDGKDWVVVIPGFASRKQAEIALSRIRRAGYPKAQLILPEFG